MTTSERGASMMRRWIEAGTRSVAALALLALALAPGLAGSAAAQPAGEADAEYESPTYGYTLVYDAGDWEVLQDDEDEDDVYDVLYLGNGTSNVNLIGDPDYAEDELDDCLGDYLGSMTEDSGFSDVEPVDERDAEGGDDDLAWTTVTYTYTFDNGDDGDYTRYLECRAIGDGATLVIIHDTLTDDYEDEVSERDDLLEGLDVPDTADDDRNSDDDQGSDDGRDEDDDQGDATGAEIADGEWVGESEDGAAFTLTVRDGGVASVSYAYECNDAAVSASATLSDPAPIEDGAFEMVTETSRQTTVVTGTFTGDEAVGTLTRETTEDDECDVELDWTAEEP